jgi:hypothetical protein
MAPFFIPDLSAWEGALPNLAAITVQPNMVGCIIKATQGTTYAPNWFIINWARVRTIGGARYGTSWFRGCYHYATPSPNGAAQADYLLAAVDRAGGWDDGDMPPAWDLEGPAWSSRQQVVDVSSQFAERVKQRLGRAPILYTGSVWRKFGVRERASFTKLWTPHLDLMEPYGWPNSSVVLYQYVGDGKYWDPVSTAARLGYPTSIPGLDAKVGMNVVLDGGAPATSISRVREILIGPQGRFLPATHGRRWIPLAIGAGLLVAGAVIASRSKEDLL